MVAQLLESGNLAVVILEKSTKPEKVSRRSWRGRN